MSNQTAPSGPAAFPTGLSDLSVDQLLMDSNRCYRELDCEHFDAAALMRYYAIIEELTSREARLLTACGLHSSCVKAFS